MWPDKTVNPYGIPPPDPAADEPERCETCGSDGPPFVLTAQGEFVKPDKSPCSDPFHDPAADEPEQCENCGGTRDKPLTLGAYWGDYCTDPFHDDQ